MLRSEFEEPCLLQRTFKCIVQKICETHSYYCYTLVILLDGLDLERTLTAVDA